VATCCPQCRELAPDRHWLVTIGNMAGGVIIKELCQDLYAWTKERLRKVLQKKRTNVGYLEFRFSDRLRVAPSELGKRGLALPSGMHDLCPYFRRQDGYLAPTLPSVWQLERTI